MAHIIRLRGPWDYEPLMRVRIDGAGVRHESSESLPPGGRVHLPADWGETLGADFRGRVRYRRRFGLPTNLGPEETVWLVVEGVDYFGWLMLNGTELGKMAGGQIAEFETTRLLAPRNLLEYDVELPSYESPGASPPRPGREQLPGGPIGEVDLEIRW
jgi:hypothetical protein